jgi:hypothetical protein
MPAVLGELADVERDLIRTCTAERRIKRPCAIVVFVHVSQRKPACSLVIAQI